MRSLSTWCPLLARGRVQSYPTSFAAAPNVFSRGRPVQAGLTSSHSLNDAQSERCDVAESDKRGDEGRSFRMGQPRRIMVAGGAGFIGSHLCDQLLEEGHQVLCVDNFFTGARTQH